jgi:hypothetical protein
MHVFQAEPKFAIIDQITKATAIVLPVLIEIGRAIEASL